MSTQGLNVEIRLDSAKMPKPGAVHFGKHHGCGSSMKISREDRDKQIVRQCLAGSQSAWHEMYSRFIGLMRGVVRSKGGVSPGDVEDVTQSAFLSLSSALKRYDFQQSLPRFICTITERALVDELRKRNALKRGADKEKVEYDDSFHDEAVDMGSRSVLQDEKLEKAETIARLRDAVNGMGPPCRDVLRLRFFEDLSYGEIATKVDASENTVTVRTRRCLDKLRSKIKSLKTG